MSPLICTVGVLFKLTLTLSATICGLASTSKVTAADCPSSPAPLVMSEITGMTIERYQYVLLYTITYKGHSMSVNQEYQNI